MTEREVAEAVSAWVGETLPDLTKTYAFLPATRTTLPDAAIEVLEKRISRGDDERRFPYNQLQQADLRVFECLVSVIVASDAEGTADEEETQQLQSFGAALEAALLEDATLGGRVMMCSPLAVFDYRLPFIQYHDGTRGRQLEANIAVAELVQGIS